MKQQTYKNATSEQICARLRRVERETRRLVMADGPETIPIGNVVGQLADGRVIVAEAVVDLSEDREEAGEGTQ